ncbi:cation:proton antiporter domain-containing protein, partial [Staphylococcus epidermidis]|uniref:cation:proton antiporter domain-containing protein n=1 Tax=Staphylococcus epidermidis TaxID=1282 RepID=UPI0037D9E938
LMLIIISTISLPLLLPTLNQINIIPTTIPQFILLLPLLPHLFTIILLTVYPPIYRERRTTISLTPILLLFTVLFYLIPLLFKRISFLQNLIDPTTQIRITPLFPLII